MSDPWYSSFFDRTYTDVWGAAGAFAGTDEELAGLRSVLPAGAGLRILDVPCGFGRHAGPLHADGHRVTGLDISADQLALAEERNPGPTYQRGDMRTPPSGPFDVVLNLYSAIGYFDDDAEDLTALSAWCDVLVPGGLLVMTGNHRDRVARIHQPGQRFPMGDTGASEEPSIDWVTGVNHSTLHMPDGTTRRFDVRLYTPTELVAMARAAGFADVEVMGDWDQRPISPETRMVLVARR